MSIYTSPIKKRRDQMISSTGPKAHWWGYRICRPPSFVVRCPHSLNIFSSETARPYVCNPQCRNFLMFLKYGVSCLQLLQSVVTFLFILWQQHYIKSTDKVLFKTWTLHLPKQGSFHNYMCLHLSNYHISFILFICSVGIDLCFRHHIDVWSC